MNPFKIATEIRAILLSSEDIKEAIGEKVFPIIAPENTEESDMH